jgi:PTS system mannose-specific IID component
MNSTPNDFSPLNFQVMARCFIRCYLVGANFNTRGMQNIGLALAMEPGLEALYPKIKPRQQARRRALQHYNTHPFWSPLLTGLFLSLERDISRGILPPAMLQRVKTTTTYTLSALGDSFFGGSLLVLFSLILTLLLLNGWTATAWIWLGVCFLGLQAFKVLTFLGSLREGIAFLNRLKRWNLINWGQRIKLLNAGLLVLLWLELWPGLGIYWEWAFWSVALMIGAFCYLRLRISRVWPVLAFVGYWSVLLFLTG